MLDFVFAIIAASAQSAAVPQSNTAIAEATPPASVTIAPDSVVVGQGVLVEGAQATAEPQTALPVLPAPAAGGDTETGFNMDVVPAGLVAEPQTPSGKFTTATEVKPIMQATKGNWIAVREYEGKDWLYVTHIFSWRCGLAAMAISVNGEPMQNWPLPDCHMNNTTPNALLEEDGLPLLTFRLGSVETITIQVVYDDLSMDVASFQRGNVLIP